MISSFRTTELLLLQEFPVVMRSCAGVLVVTVPMVARVLIVALKLFGFWLVTYIVLSFAVATMVTLTEVSLGSAGTPELSCV